MCVCERNRSSDCQTSARCSAADQGCEGEGGGGGQIRRRVRKNRKGQVPTPVQKINVKTQNLKKQKRAAEKKRCARLRVEGLKLSSG